MSDEQQAQAQEEKELEAISIEVKEFFKSLESRGYGLVTFGEFYGSEMNVNHTIVKLKE